MDIEESAVLQGIDAAKRQTNMKAIVDGNDEIDGMEKQFIDGLFNLESQRAYVNELKLSLKDAIEDLNPEDLLDLKGTLSKNVGSLVLMEVRHKAVEKTLGDVQARLKAIESAGTAPAT